MGVSTRQRICRREASSVRIIFAASGSAEPRPASVLTVIGKKQISATTTAFGQIPKPNQMIRIGAIDEDRDRLRGDDQWVEGALDSAREVHERGEADADDECEAEAEQHLAQSHPGVFGEQRATLPERFGDFGGRRDEKAFEAEQRRRARRSRRDLPGADQHHDQQDAGRSQRLIARRPPQCLHRVLAHGDEGGVGDRLVAIRRPRRRRAQPVTCVPAGPRARRRCRRGRAPPRCRG